ncbi:MAG TPA: hypothetical protein VF614_17180 [Chthoniobacteraceae bacterium]|jgi:hypothetical protein
MRSLWIKAAVVLAGVWLVAGGLILWARHARPTPESIAKLVEQQQLEGRSTADRMRALEKVADQLNALDYEQRREVRLSRKLDRFFRALTPEEQARFLDLTLPSGFKQMMEAFNKMEPEKRKKFVERAVNEMKEREGEQRGPGSDDPNVGKIIDQGLRSFYSDASAEVKMDLAPLIEQMQQNLQGFR